MSRLTIVVRVVEEHAVRVKRRACSIPECICDIDSKSVGRIDVLYEDEREFDVSACVRIFTIPKRRKESKS